MKRETMIWTIVLVVAGVFLAIRGFTGNMGQAYSRITPQEFANVAADGEEPQWVAISSEAALDHDLTGTERIAWNREAAASKIDSDRGESGVGVSFKRTLGIWVAAFFTLAIFSFLYRDNPLYKIAESCVVGVSAAYWMVVGFWDVLIPNLFARLSPELIKAWAMPGLSGEAAHRDLAFLVPLVLGVMLLWRLAPAGAWIARWPLAFIIGSTAGIRMVGFIQADFLSQIRNSIVPIIVMDPGVTGIDIFWDSLRNVILVVGVLCCLVYFFFSFEHKGAIGHTARVGIWFLMVTFGAAFGYTVMGRIALLAIRIEFLVDDWLWLIDPAGHRTVAAAAALLPGLGVF